ncbi:MAG TPA: hypothetical protein VFT59_01890, partial [Candidatus Saccharimonadales bacterium]|nr:hypothetical protein [Candidatus Saccharimonadales bacterium]
RVVSSLALSIDSLRVGGAMSGIDSGGPVFNPDGTFRVDPYEEAETSKRVGELFWVVPLVLLIIVVVLWVGFAAVGWPLLVPLIVTILFLAGCGAFAWFGNRRP